MAEARPGVHEEGGSGLESVALSRRTTYTAAIIGLLLTVVLVLYPEDAFRSSVNGLRLWFDIVLPALLPFFVMAEMMMGLGVIHFIGVLLEPLMRPLFRIPGAGAFAAALGLAAGYPLGAKLAGNLARARLCTDVEGERLVSLANTADPLFMVGAVAVGMFGLPEIGGTLAVSHYLAVICVGLLMRFHAPKVPATVEPPASQPILSRALSALYEARRNDGRPIGTLFGDAVRESVNALLFIGGTIIMFSVLIRVLTVAGVIGFVANIIHTPLSALGVDPTLTDALLVGVVEITNGARAASAANASLLYKVAIASGIIAWSGLSVHAQVAAMLHGTNIRLTPYIIARSVHAVLATVFAWLLLGPAHGVFNMKAIPVIAPLWATETVTFGARLFHATAGATQFALASLAVVAAGAIFGKLSVFWTRLR